MPACDKPYRLQSWHHWSPQDYLRLVMSENIHRGEYLRQSSRIQQLNIPAISAIRERYERGIKTKVFRPGFDPLDIHASISAICFFNVSNRHTSGSVDAHLQARRASVMDMVVRFVKK
ncbi:MAG: hypothetical protein QM776_03600 [Rhodocyclaceae bacterium]